LRDYHRERAEGLEVHDGLNHAKSVADYSRDLRTAEWGSKGQFAQPKAAADVRFGSKADIEAPSSDVRFTPKNGHQVRALGCRLCGTRRHLRRARNEPSEQVSGGSRRDLLVFLNLYQSD